MCDGDSCSLQGFYASIEPSELHTIIVNKNKNDVQEIKNISDNNLTKKKIITQVNNNNIKNNKNNRKYNNNPVFGINDHGNSNNDSINEDDKISFFQSIYLQFIILDKKFWKIIDRNISIITIENNLLMYVYRLCINAIVIMYNIKNIIYIIITLTIIIYNIYILHMIYIILYFKTIAVLYIFCLKYGIDIRLYKNKSMSKKYGYLSSMFLYIFLIIGIIINNSLNQYPIYRICMIYNYICDMIILVSYNLIIILNGFICYKNELNKNPQPESIEMKPLRKRLNVK